MSDCEKKVSPEEAGTVAIHSVSDDDFEDTDAVFGEISSDGPNYRNVGWIGSTILMLKTQMGLGILSIPYVLSTLGLVPGLICLLAIGAITTWSDYVIGTFKLRHREVYNLADVFYIWYGPLGRSIVGVIYCVFMTFCAGSGFLSLSIALNAVSVNAICTAGFVAVAAVAVFIVASIQTLGRIQILGWIGVISIALAVFTLTIAVGVQERPSAAPAEDDWNKEFVIFGNPTFAEASSALGSIVFAYCGTPAFFGIISEMRDPRLYTRGLMICQSILTSVYVIVGVVVYFYCGQFVASPALGSAGPLLKKVCYGLAIPGLTVTSLIYTHMPAKYIFVHTMRNSEHLSKNTTKHWIAWLGCVLGCVIFSYVVASAIPVFGGLVGLIGALFGTFMSMQPMAFMWLYDNWHRKETAGMSWRLLVGWNIFIIVIGTFIMIAGTYGSIVDIMTSYKTSGGSAAWSCADNSNST